MTTAQTAERKDLYRTIRRLPDDKAAMVADYIRFIERDTPNAETRQAMRDIKEKRNITSYESVDAMFAALSK